MSSFLFVVWNAIPFVVAAICSAVCLSVKLTDMPRKSTYGLMVVWVLLWTVAYWILGPYSYVRFYDEADIAIARCLHDVNNHIGGGFLHGIQGGGDYYAAQGFAGQYLSFERSLLSFLPLWLALLGHKLAVVCCSFGGSYLLLRSATGVDRFYAVCFSVFISVFNPYALYSTVQHGVGYAAVPLAIYIFTCRTGKRNYLISAALFSIFVAISGSPTHSFPVLYFGVVLSASMLPIANYSRFLLALLVLPTAVILNWSEVLYGLSQFGQLSARALTSADGKSIGKLLWGGMTYFYGKTDYYVIGFVFSPAAILSVTTLALGFYYKARLVKRAAVNIVAAIYIPSVLYIVSALPQLSFLNSVNFDRISFYIIIPVSLLAAHLTGEKTKLTNLLPLLFLGFAVLTLTQNNMRAGLEAYNGNQLRLTSIANLKDRSWEPEEPYRVVTAAPYGGFHPNFSWAYGMEALDGYTNLIHKGIVEFWHYGIHRNEYTAAQPAFLGGNLYVTYTFGSEHAEKTEFVPGQPVDMDEKIDVNMLKLANTGYIISYFPLRGADLVKISGPDKEYDMPDPEGSNTGLGRHTSRLRDYVFSAPDISIYEINGYSKRAFFPAKLIYIEQGLNLSQKLRFISDRYEPNIGFTADRNLKPGAGKVLDVKKIPDGYEVEVQVARPGVFVLNTYPLPYWRAYIEGRSVPTFAINEIHLGVNLDAGSHTVLFKYARPLLRDKIFGLLH
jgi:hypothetical protein